MTGTNETHDRRRLHAVVTAGLLALGFALSLSTGVHAQEPSFYAGEEDLFNARIKVSGSGLRAAGVTSPARAGDRSETGWRMFAGYRLSRYLALEAAHAFIGDFDPAGIDSMEPKVWTLGAVGTLPLPHDFSLFAGAGVARSATGVSVDGTGDGPVPRRKLKDTAWGYHAGVGAAFDFHRNVGVRVKWERYRVADGLGGKSDVNLFSWGARVKF